MFPTFSEKDIAGITVGMKIVLVKDIPDPYVTLNKGLQGTIRSIDPASIFVAWENGHTLSILPEDKECFKIQK